MVGLQPLELCILVRVQVSEPRPIHPKRVDFAILGPYVKYRYCPRL